MQRELLTRGLQRNAFGVFLGVLGYFLNGFPLQVWSGVDCLPGPLLTYLTIGLFGTRIGVCQAAISSARTLFMWQHPWGLFIGICEAVFVGIFRSRNVPLAASSLLFWLLPGLAVVFGIYRGHLGLSWQFAGLTFLTDFLCSLISGGLAQLFLSSGLASKLSGRLALSQQPVSLRSDAFAAFLLAAIVPLASWLAFSGNRLRGKSELRAKAELVSQAKLVRDCIDYRVRLLNDLPKSVSGDQRQHLELLRAALGDEVFEHKPDSADQVADHLLLLSASSGSGPWVRLSLQQSCGPQITMGNVKISIFDENDNLEKSNEYGAAPKPNTWFASADDLSRAWQEKSDVSFEFMRNGVDPFRRPRYLAGQAILASGGRVISYIPASGVDPSILAYHQLTLSWIGAVSLLAVLFAFWFGRRLTLPLQGLRTHLELFELGMEVGKRSDERVPEELRPVWSSVANLELRICEKTKHTELLIAEARQHDEQKSRFLATVSHELRTPLNVILGLIYCVRQDPVTESQARSIGQIEDAGEHLLLVLNEILDFSKIESGSIEINLQKIDLIDLVESAAQLMQPDTSGKPVTLTWTFDTSTPRKVYSDPVRLRQILLNLQSNALKFTESGAVSIRVAKSLSEGDNFSIEVTDTGCGISQWRMSRLYEPFVRFSDEVVAEKNAGSGLGLSIVKHLVDALGGTIEIKSVLGAGTTVYVDLPGATIESTEVAEDHQKVAVIGQESTGKQMLCSHLKYLGHDVEVYDRVNPPIPPDSVVFVDFNTDQDQQAEIRAIARSGARVIVYRTRQQSQMPTSGESLPWPPTIKAIDNLLKNVADVHPDTWIDGIICSEVPLRILVAEDHAPSRAVIEFMLQSRGYMPLVVADGERAWAALRDFEFDMAILDLQMPQIGGLDLARRCHNQVERIPTLCALTASAFASDREAAMRAGFHTFITKPLRQHDLNSALECCKWRDPCIWEEKVLISFLDLSSCSSVAKAQAILDACWRWLENFTDQPKMEAREEAHRLKGAAALIGAKLLAEYLEHVEEALMDAPAELPERMTVADLRKCVEREFQRLVDTWRGFTARAGM